MKLLAGEGISDRSKGSTLALKPRADVNRMPKQGYQWPNIHFQLYVKNFSCSDTSQSKNILLSCPIYLGVLLFSKTSSFCSKKVLTRKFQMVYHYLQKVMAAKIDRNFRFQMGS